MSGALTFFEPENQKIAKGESKLESRIRQLQATFLGESAAPTSQLVSLLFQQRPQNREYLLVSFSF